MYSKTIFSILPHFFLVSREKWDARQRKKFFLEKIEKFLGPSPRFGFLTYERRFEGETNTIRGQLTSIKMEKRIGSKLQPRMDRGRY